MKTKFLTYVTLFLLEYSLGAQVPFGKVNYKVVTQKTKGLGEDQVLDNAREKWVVDSVIYDDYQSDGLAESTLDDICPPIPHAIEEDACIMPTCKSDVDCPDDFRCCYNGCVYACLPEMKPPPLVDWRKEPQRSRSGISWLISGPPGPGTEVELCSTTPSDPDEDPLLCPRGYFCHVTDTGNPKKGIPNSGYCVKETDGQYSQREEEILLSSAGLKSGKTCTVDNIRLLEGASIKLKRKSCRCNKGFLSCKRKKGKNNVDVEIKDKSPKNSRPRKRNKGKKGRKKST
ncbi:uncharacterized protein LOC128203047 [Mya arenaria]|uniref:uncharacterized protein LOC128203047 n=1 Tax=Mya arenaria TaxID=6604 RepID=UPI0022E79E8E|nr:uncharacterized protein LOC128203047 [Mya arenaria]